MSAEEEKGQTPKDDEPKDKAAGKASARKKAPAKAAAEDAAGAEGASAAAEESKAKPARKAPKAKAPAAKADGAQAAADEAPEVKQATKAKAASKAKGEPKAKEAAKAKAAPRAKAAQGADAGKDSGRRRVVRARARYVRTSARKARMVCVHIRGKSVQEARAILAFTPREVARDWSKLLESAVANAESNHELLQDDLIVREAYADEGPTIKRFRPRAMGRATPIRKRTSHLTITLTPGAPSQNTRKKS